MKRKVSLMLLVISILLVLVLSGCKITRPEIQSTTTGSVSEVGLKIDPDCKTGMTIYLVNVYNEQNYEVERAYTVRPNNGCELPGFVCIYEDGYDAGGSSCVPIE